MRFQLFQDFSVILNFLIEITLKILNCLQLFHMLKKKNKLKIQIGSTKIVVDIF